MDFAHCPNCKENRGFKRHLGFGTFFAFLATVGMWIIAIPFYPKRCVVCGYAKGSEAKSNKPSFL